METEKCKKKIIWKEYHLWLKKKEYNILMPMISLKEAQVTSEIWDGVFIDGDRQTLECLWDTLVTLSLEPNRIIYLPIRKLPRITASGYLDNVDLVFYNWHIQFDRHLWKRLRGRLQHTKESVHVIRYAPKYFLENGERKWEKYCRSSRYYKKKNRVRTWETPDTLFVEGSWILNYKDAAGFFQMLKGDWMEKEEEHATPTTIAAFPLGVEAVYLTKEWWDRWIQETYGGDTE